MKNVDILERLEQVDTDALDKIGRSIFHDLYDKLYRLVVFQGLGDAQAAQEDMYDAECIEVSQYDDEELDALMELF